jgi:hypothetical protein
MREQASAHVDRARVAIVMAIRKAISGSVLAFCVSSKSALELTLATRTIGH